jgi:hypothetical protein
MKKTRKKEDCAGARAAPLHAVRGPCQHRLELQIVHLFELINSTASVIPCVGWLQSVYSSQLSQVRYCCTRVPRARGRVRPVKPGETVQHQGTVRATAWRVRLTANSSEVCHTLRMCCMRSSYRASLESFVIHEALLVLLK